MVLDELQRLLEFYFSDASLSRDRFMQHTMGDHDGGIPVAVFLRFNKIKALTQDASSVASAASQSPLLHVSSDRAIIQRKDPFRSQDTASQDERTVYVETLPRNYTHEKVQEIFSQCGSVLYVELPKYVVPVCVPDLTLASDKLWGCCQMWQMASRHRQGIAVQEDCHVRQPSRILQDADGRSGLFLHH